MASTDSLLWTSTTHADGYALLMHGDAIEVAAARRILEGSRLEADGRGHPLRLSRPLVHVFHTT